MRGLGGRVWDDIVEGGGVKSGEWRDVCKGRATKGGELW